MHSVLLVDDEPFVRLSLASLCPPGDGFDVAAEAGNGAEALAALADHPEIDIVLLDLSMPVMDGLEVLRRLRADPRTKLLPVVVLTLSNEEQDIAEAYRLGVNSYVRKPVDFDRFNELLHHMGRYWLEFNESPTRRRGTA